MANVSTTTYFSVLPVEQTTFLISCRREDSVEQHHQTKPLLVSLLGISLLYSLSICLRYAVLLLYPTPPFLANASGPFDKIMNRGENEQHF